MEYSKMSWNDQREDAMVTKKTRWMGNNKEMHYIKLALLSILAGCLLLSGYAKGEDTKSSTKSSDIEIKLESTRPRLTPGTSIGITAEITNRSGKVIYLHEKYVAISVPPELAPDPESPHFYTYFPTEDHGDKDYVFPIIAIAPGESYKVFCSIKPSNLQKDTSTEDASQKDTSKNSSWKNLVSTVLNKMRFIFFVPGDYSVDLTAQYWIDPKKPPTDLSKPQTDPYHTMIASRRLTVDAPQFVILFGAMIGGLISYFLFPQARRRFVTSETDKEAPSKSKKFGKEVFGIIGAVLLSAIVTILLSRISETQFLIRVTVSDFWGAVAIGFVANYAGAEVLNKIIDRYLNRQTAQKKENGTKSGS